MKAYLSVCTLYKDEARYLPEWLEFHRLVGVERFFLYNNNSTDNHMEVLAPYIEEGTVVQRDWPLFPGQYDAFRRVPEGSLRRLALDRVPRSRRVPVLADRPPVARASCATSRSTRASVVNSIFHGTSGHETPPEGLRDRELHPPHRAPRAAQPDS